MYNKVCGGSCPVLIPVTETDGKLEPMLAGKGFAGWHAPIFPGRCTHIFLSGTLSGIRGISGHGMRSPHSISDGTAP